VAVFALLFANTDRYLSCLCTLPNTPLLQYSSIWECYSINSN